jgi:fumarylacetoacetate (FAA) hydrolase
MKLATLRNGRPDGHLVVVSHDLNWWVSAGRITANLQSALDNWAHDEPLLRELSYALDRGTVASQPFDAAQAVAPLPRAYQWIDCSAYPAHLERISALKGSRPYDPEAEKPLMYQGASDNLSGAQDPILIPSDDVAADFEAEIAVIIGPVPRKPTREEAAAAIRLVTFCNDVSFRRLVPDDLDRGFGFFHSKPSTAFAPVVATFDSLAGSWADQRLHARLRITVNDKLFGAVDAGLEMRFDFVDLIMAAAETRELGAGTILGGGTVSVRHDELLPIKAGGIGFACIAEARAAEKAKGGEARTPFLQQNDIVRIAALDRDDRTMFGTIAQRVRRFER